MRADNSFRYGPDLAMRWVNWDLWEATCRSCAHETLSLIIFQAKMGGPGVLCLNSLTVIFFFHFFLFFSFCFFFKKNLVFWLSYDWFVWGVSMTMWIKSSFMLGVGVLACRVLSSSLLAFLFEKKDFQVAVWFDFVGQCFLVFFIFVFCFYF